MVSMKKWLTMIALSSLLIVVGCSTDDDAENESVEEEQQEEEEQTPPPQLGSDEELQTLLEEEEEVEEVMVQVVDGEEERMVNIDIQIGAEEEWSDDLLTKYEEIIREHYPDEVLDLIIVQDGEVQEQVTLE
ncbi:hypothetical protein ACFPTR_12525 [Aliibacillus thermotolerans]|uniref:Uncharacterized protein n=1 Tax=Aliibacillus thermotolerans TaxID=1834418 RepID=A0ABW0U867_9BACI|nr:hypothetical protein [Aliibacillus thermotolerans]MDA3129929.1 hypothetical protein [Aliibacillus thermotolerans]